MATLEGGNLKSIRRHACGSILVKDCLDRDFVDNQRMKMLALIALLLAPPTQADWVALAKGGFVLPAAGTPARCSSR